MRRRRPTTHFGHQGRAEKVAHLVLWLLRRRRRHVREPARSQGWTVGGWRVPLSVGDSEEQADADSGAARMTGSLHSILLSPFLESNAGHCGWPLGGRVRCACLRAHVWRPQADAQHTRQGRSGGFDVADGTTRFILLLFLLAQLCVVWPTNRMRPHHRTTFRAAHTFACCYALTHRRSHVPCC